MEKLTKWIQENIVQSIGIIGGTVAIIIVVVFVCFFNNNENDTKPTSEKSAAGGITTDRQIEKTTTYRNSETNTSLEKPEETTDEESTAEDITDENITTYKNVTSGKVTQEITTTQSQTVVNTIPTTQPQTTKTQVTQQTTKQQTTTQQTTVATQIRGKDGIILEKLYIDRYINEHLDIETIKVPENREELADMFDGDRTASFGCEYTDLIVRRHKANVFNNDIYLGKTTEEYIRQIYGTPYREKKDIEDDEDRTLYYYRYTKGTGLLEDDIYICFIFKKLNNGLIGLSTVNIDYGTEMFSDFE